MYYTNECNKKILQSVRYERGQAVRRSTHGRRRRRSGLYHCESTELPIYQYWFFELEVVRSGTDFLWPRNLCNLRTKALTTHVIFDVDLQFVFLYGNRAVGIDGWHRDNTIPADRSSPRTSRSIAGV